MITDDEIKHRALAMKRPQDRAARERDERHADEAMHRALEPRGSAAEATTTDGQQFSPMAELAMWRRWATGILGGDGLQGDEEQRAALTAAVGRAVTIADEAFGLGPVEPIDETLTRIERGISKQHIRNERLESFAKAAIAFVDEQGKRVNGMMGIESAHDFAAQEFAELVQAVEGAAASPPVVLALIARNRELSAALDEALTTWNRHDEFDSQKSDRDRLEAVLEKGVVLP